MLREAGKPEGDQSPEAVAGSMMLAAFAESVIMVLSPEKKR